MALSQRTQGDRILSNEPFDTEAVVENFSDANPAYNYEGKELYSRVEGKIGFWTPGGVLRLATIDQVEEIISDMAKVREKIAPPKLFVFAPTKIDVGSTFSVETLAYDYLNREVLVNQVSGFVNTALAGQYVLRFEATDTLGQRVELSHTVTVGEVSPYTVTIDVTSISAGAKIGDILATVTTDHPNPTWSITGSNADLLALSRPPVSGGPQIAAVDEYTEPLTAKNARHLLGRATLGASYPDHLAAIGDSAIDVFERIALPYQTVVRPPGPRVYPGGEPMGQTATLGNEDDHNRWGTIYANVRHLIESPTSLNEMQVYFMRELWSTRKDTVPQGLMLHHEDELHRYYALGNFKEHALAMCKSQAMGYNLDTVTNVKGATQENFSREILEIYTIGKRPQVGPGDFQTYRDVDVTNTAIIFSGWQGDETMSQRINPDTGLPELVPDPTKHDFSPVQLSDKFIDPNTGSPYVIPTAPESIAGMEQRLEKWIDIIYEQEATAEYLMFRLYEWYFTMRVNFNFPDDPDTRWVLDNIIEPGKQMLLANGYEVRPVLKMLLTSKHFFDVVLSDTNDIIDSVRTKSPLHDIISLYRKVGTLLPGTPGWNDKYGETTNKQYRHEYSIMQNFVRRSVKENGLDIPFGATEVVGYAAYTTKPQMDHFWFTGEILTARKAPIDNLLRFGFWVPWDINGDGQDTTFATAGKLLPQYLDWIKDLHNDPSIPFDGSDSDQVVDLVIYMLVYHELIPGVDGAGEPILVDNEFIGRQLYVEALTGALANGTWAYNFNEFLTGENNHVPGAMEALIRVAILSLQGMTF